MLLAFILGLLCGSAIACFVIGMILNQNSKDTAMPEIYVYPAHVNTDNQKDLWRAAFNEGFNAGHREGYDEGFKEGKEVGFKEGKEAGYDEGYDIGYDDGYDSA